MSHSHSPSLDPATRDQLIQAAFAGRDRAYSPHSHFRVGAALLTTSGEVITGCSVDCAAYSETICAERVAIVKAVSEGIRSFVALAVVSDALHAISPCGPCRQVLREFCPLNLCVFLAPADWTARRERGDALTGVKETTLVELFPMSYDEGFDLPRWSKAQKDERASAKNAG
ncbi:cytidine deaminase [Obba rivulosa]|uniref:cytidine deaminase n=1 Tax=Obba rivulosa TaxID=1052685 RepID=A0A8E2DH25_9APHY|nr:cytidine deaminase [Obba rivulosa]